MLAMPGSTTSMSRMSCDAGEHVGEPRLRIAVVELCGLDQRDHDGGAIDTCTGLPWRICHTIKVAPPLVGCTERLSVYVEHFNTEKERNLWNALFATDTHAIFGRPLICAQRRPPVSTASNTAVRLEAVIEAVELSTLQPNVSQRSRPTTFDSSVCLRDGIDDRTKWMLMRTPANSRQFRNPLCADASHVAFPQQLVEAKDG
jgi:hypothetical protein